MNISLHARSCLQPDGPNLVPQPVPSTVVDVWNRYALIAPDLVVGPQTDPLRNLPVLASLLRQDLLDLEGLVRGL